MFLKQIYHVTELTSLIRYYGMVLEDKNYKRFFYDLADLHPY
jgi:hypothetical protein